MKTTKLLVLTLAISLHTVFAQENMESDYSFPLLEGPYMGQEPPGMVAEVFAPGIISKEGWEIEGVFAPGMKEFYFTTSPDEPFRPTVIGFRQQDNVWKKYIEFTRRGEIAFSPDGSRMHMAKGYKDRTGDGWSERKSMGAPFTDMHIMGITVSDKGTFFFDQFERPDTIGAISYSRLINGKYEPRQKMGKEINTGTWIAHPKIAPDESYLIWDVVREDGYGGSDLNISFRQKDGSWVPAINMGDKINTALQESGAHVTDDGKYLFFSRGEWEVRVDGSTNWVGKSYWVDAQVIENLRPKQ